MSMVQNDMRCRMDDLVKRLREALVLWGIFFFFSAAYAATSKDIPGDLDKNFSVGLEDLVILAEQWLEPYGCIEYEHNCADIYGEDGVDVRDLSLIAVNWRRIEVPLFINEVLASNRQTEPSNNGMYDDWIEIYNASEQAVDLAGMYLTDNADIPTKWQIPFDRPSETTVGPNGFVFVWADGTVSPPASGLHASFKVNSDGDDIWLFDTDGQTVIDSLVFGEQVTDVSVGREPDAGVAVKTLLPTPGSSNNASFFGVVEDTKFSHDRGFYSQGFNLEITCATPYSEIYYTLNGSEPDASDPLYTEPVLISQTSCVRAVAVRPGYKSSNIDTHTYIFISDVLTQSADGTKPAAEWPNSGTSVNGQQIDYGMDPDIVNDAGYGPLVDDALLAIPTLSIVTDLSNLFDAATGIYVNAQQFGPTWERPASLELIFPDGREGFQVEMGIRIRGGWSRQDSCPKHAFRCFFRVEYGDSKLKYNWFENEEDAGGFDKMDLRTAQNYSWSFKTRTESDYNTFVRDVFSRDLQRQMGQPYTRSRFYHLYINGQYWGLYQTQERSEAAYAAGYFGGSREDYDVIKADAGLSGTKMVEATDGTLDSHNAFWALANQLDSADLAGKAVLYNQMLGLSPDGSLNPGCPIYLDPDNLIDMMLNVFYVSEKDSPISAFFGNDELNNWFGIFNRKNPDGFKYFRHDAEHSMDRGGGDRTGPYTVLNEKTSPNWFNPQTLHQWLISYPEYRIRFADRAYKHMFNNGAMTEAAAKAQFDRRTAEIEMAIIAESARWGDAKTDPPQTKARWETAVANARGFLNNRVNTVIGYLRNKDWYPSINPPELLVNGALQYGGQASVGNALTMVNPNSAGTIYYTIDGSDPRLAGGAINPAAQEYTPGESTGTALVNTASVWKYLYDGSDQGTAWRTLTFDDAGWSSGPGELGFGDGGEATDIGPGVDGRRSAYFRHYFSVSDVSNFSTLSINLLYDDGAVIYINEQEVARMNMPGGDIDYDTLASSSIGDDAAITITGINPAVLIAGDNVLAVEIHQVSDTSSDISFDLELVAEEWTEENTELTLEKSTCLKARVLNGSEWSALADTVFSVGPVSENLRITELMYHPADPNTEFVELQNIGAEPINLNLVKFTKGIDFTFGDIQLAPGAFVLVVEHNEAFETNYGTGLNIAGQYSGHLENSGERIELKNAVSEDVHDFTYDDGWCEITDGLGFSLTVINAASTDPNDWDRKSGWRSSLAKGGTPGSVDSVLPEGSILINELLAHSHGTTPDWIELYNKTEQAINIGGWFLSDDNSDPDMIRKYRIPDNTIIHPHSYLVFIEDESFGSPSASIPFGLSEAGETVYLYSGQNGEITGYYQTQEDFDASESGVSFGRYEKAELSGGCDFTRMHGTSQGFVNTGPWVPAVVITEIHYNPPEGAEYEFVELYNRSGADVILETEVTTEVSPGVFVNEFIPWRLEGIGYEFPANTIIPADTHIIVAKEPTMYNSLTCDVYGPYDGKLDNGGEQIQIQIPGDREYGQSRYWIPIEKIDYDDMAPWPTSPDGGGDSIHRLDANVYGRDYSNWQALSPSPGRFN